MRRHIYVCILLLLLAVARGSLPPLTDFCDRWQMERTSRFWELRKTPDGYDFEGIDCEWTDKMTGWDLHDSMGRIANPCLHAPCADGVMSEGFYREYYFLRDSGQICEYEVRCQCPDGSWDSGWLHNIGIDE